MSLELRGARHKSVNSAQAQRAALCALLELLGQPAPLAAEREQQALVQLEEQRSSPQALPLSEPLEQQVRPVAQELPRQARAPSRALLGNACPRIQRPLP
jgi:hypothetical protein